MNGNENRPPRPLPPEIYRRRRIAAVVALVVVVALLIWGAVALFGGNDEDPQPAATTDEAAAPATSDAESTTEESEDPEATDTSKKDPDDEDDADSADSRRDDEAVDVVDKNTCDVNDLRITASTSAPTYSGDQQPSFHMTVENPTRAECVIDFDKETLRFEVYGLASNNRMWADTDCNDSVASGTETFEAGSKRYYEAIWSRTTSSPGQCDDRQPVPPASYYLHGVIGNNASEAQPFNLA